MGISIRTFVSDESGLTPIAMARWHRIMTGKETVSDWAESEVKVFEVALEVQGRTILRPIRVLAYRVPVGGDGRVNMHDLAARARRRISDVIEPETVETVIRKLERDASYFWVPTEMHWSALGRLLNRPASELKRALHRMPDSGS